MASSYPTSMRAWQFTTVQTTLDKALQLNTSATPPPVPSKPDQILIKVHATSLNPIDYKLAELPIVGRFITSKPATPCMDFAGTVQPTNSSTTSSPFQPGQRVFGRLSGPNKFGSLAEYIVAPTSGVAALPDNVSYTEGAAMATAGLTALQSLNSVRTGDTGGQGKAVFVNGGSGGVGTFTVQIGKLLGAKVAATCSGANVQLVKDLGADEVVDYRSTGVVSWLQQKKATYDLIVDNVGSPAGLHKAGDVCLKETGSVMQVGAGMDFGSVVQMMRSAVWPAFLGGAKRSWSFAATASKKEDLELLARWAGEKRLKIVVDSTYPFEEAPKAFEKLKTGRARGKVVVSDGVE